VTAPDARVLWHVVVPMSRPILATLTIITWSRTGTLPVASDHHHRPDVAGADRGHRESAGASSRQLDAGDGGDDGGDGAAGSLFCVSSGTGPPISPDRLK